MAAKKPMEERRGARSKAPRAFLSFGLYRLSLAPVFAAVLILAFSLGSPAAPLGSSLIPEAFEGAHAFDRLTQMAKIASGGGGQARLLAYMRSQMSSLGSPASGGYTIAVKRIAEETTSGTASQTLLIGHRAGTSTQAPIVLLATRDAGQRGAVAQLSGAAGLLEIASVLAQGETKHPVYVIFAAGAGDGRAAIASWLESALGGRLDAAIALGDLAGTRLERPLVQPFSGGAGLAPEVLTGTVSAALAGTMGISPGRPSLISQLAHLAFPLSVTEQGRLNAIGVPSVSVGLAGERGPTASEPVSQSRLQAVGRGLLSAFYALDRGGEVTRAKSTGLRLAGRVLPQWPIALLTLTLLLGPLFLSGEALVRLARARRERMRRWMLLPLLCAWPFVFCAVSLKLLSLVGLLHSPPNPAGASVLGFGVGSVVALILALTVLAGCWWAWFRFTMASSPRKVPPSGVAGVASLFSGCLLALLVWLMNPYASLLLIPALHAWILAISARHRPRRRGALLALLLIPALAPLALLLAFYALWLGLGPSQILLEGMVMVGGGYVGLGGVLVWSIALGLLVAMVIATLGAQSNAIPSVHPPPEDRFPVLYPSRAPVYRERVLR